MQKKHWNTLFIILVTSVLTAAMWGSLSGPFVLDDRPKIFRNPDIKNWEQITKKLIYPYSKNQSFYRNDPSRPLVYLTYALNYKLHGLNPFGYRLFNLILHILNSILVYFIFLNLFKRLKARGPPAAFFVGMIFAFHPINVPISLYIFNRSASLAALFILLGLFFHIFIKNNKLKILTVAVCFALSLLSRQDAVVFAALVPAYDYFFNKRLYFKTYIPLALIAASYLLFRILIFGQIGDAEAQNLSWGRLEYFTLQLSLLPKYIGKLLFPFKLSLYYNYKLFDFRHFIFIAISTLFAGVVIWQRKKLIEKYKGELLFSLTLFFIFWAPTSSIFPTTVLFGENRVYLAGIGLFSILTLLILSLKHYRIIGAILIGLAISLSIARAHTFRSAISLWHETASNHPTSFSYNNLGLAYKEEGQLQPARKSYERALTINPRNAKALNNLGNVLVDENKLQEANRAYQKALSLGLSHPVIYFNLGRSYFLQGDLDQAKTYLKKAIEKDPNYKKARELFKKIQ